MDEKKRYNSIDCFRLVCAVMVIAIHTHPFQDIDRTLGYWFTEIIPRIGVPFFFAVSGFFYFQKLESGEKAFWHYTKRLVLPYTVWSILYFILEFCSWGHGNLKGFAINCIYSYFLAGSYYHLWFIPALFYSLILVTALYKVKAGKLILPIAVLFYLIGCLGCSYQKIGIQISVLNCFFQWNRFEMIRRILLFGFPFFTSGHIIIWIQKRLRTDNGQRCWSLLLLFFLLWLGELWLVHNLGLKDTIVQTVFLYPLVITVVLLLCNYNAKRADGLAQYSRTVASVMYYFHPIVILLIDVITNNRLMTVTETPRFLITVVVSICLGILFHKYGGKGKGILT